MPHPEIDGPLSRTGNQVWRFFVLVAAIVGAVMFAKSEVWVVAQLAAEEKAAPIRLDVEALKKQSYIDQEAVKEMKRNVYRLCLANRIMDCEP